MSDLFGQRGDDGQAGGRLYLAVRPDAETAARIEQLAQGLRKRLGLTGTPLPAARLQVALNPLGSFIAIPQNIVDAASRAVSSLVATPPFALVFDRVVSFRAGDDKPLALVGREGVLALEALHRQLQAALARHGIRPEARFKPHLTLLRDRRGVPEQAIEPVAWTVDAIELRHALPGRAPETLARWSLGTAIAPPQADPAQFSDRDRHWMHRALALAAQAGQADDEVPVGAVIVDAGGELVAEASNLNGERHDPSAHAELLAIAAAGRALGSRRLSGCTLYVSLEPCPMCAAALVHARIDQLVFAAPSPKTGAAGSVFDLVRDHRHNHAVQVRGGLLADEAGQLLSDWFRRKREAR